MAEEPVEDRLEWSICLSRCWPGKAVAAVTVITLALACAAVVTRSAWMTALAALLLVGSVAEFFLPVRYTVDEKGAGAKSVVSAAFIEWSRVRRALLGPDGVRLSPLAKPSVLDSTRGVYLRFGERRREVLSLINHYAPNVWKDNNA